MRASGKRSFSGVVCAAAVVSGALLAPAAAQVTRRVSVSSSGAQGLGGSSDTSISADGRWVAFESFAPNLDVNPDTNNLDDVFVRDRQNGTTRRVSLSSHGVPGNSRSEDPSISSDGRYVSYFSSSSNLVLGDTNATSDVFVSDLQTGATERVSVDSAGAQGNGACAVYSSISPDGLCVAFVSVATNLVPGDTNAVDDIFVRDRPSGTTERISVDSSGAEGNAMSTRPSISADGRYVAFQGLATNLVAGDTNGFGDIFVRDRLSGTTERVSVDSTGAEGDEASYFPAISPDGRYVAFWSAASNLVGGDTNGSWDVFVRDRQLGTTERVSVDSGGAEGNSDSADPSISPDGRYVAFTSAATNLVGGDTNGVLDVFVRDRQLGTTERVSVQTSGAQANFDSGLFGGSAITPDGRYVAFDSVATNLVTGDGNGTIDIFVRDRAATGFTILCDPGVGGVVGCPCGNPPAGGGRGCDNFGAGPAESGSLTATGIAYLGQDTVVLHATGENNSSLTVFWTGTALIAPGVVHGAGVRCASGLKRLYTGSASGGAISRPGVGDPGVSARSTAVGAPISAGQTRYYFTIYRDPGAAGPCGSSATTINLTNTGAIGWNL